MDVEVRQLRYFVVIAEELNFSRAAKRLSLTQPALSLQVQRLEETLGVILFERNRRRMRLSEPGKVFLQLAQKTLARLEQGLEEVRRMGGSGPSRLRVAFPEYANLAHVPPILHAFEKRFPEVQLEQYELFTPQQLQALRKGQVDVGLLLQTHTDPEIACEALFQEDLVVYLPEGHPLAQKPVVHFRDLDQQPVLMGAWELSPVYFDQIEGYCRQLGIRPDFTVHQTFYSSTTLMRMVASGKLAILVPWLSKASYPGVVSRPLVEPTPRLNFVVAYSQDVISPLARQFAQIAQEVIGQMDLQKTSG